MLIDHIGIAVADLEESVRLYQALGLRAAGTEEVPEEGVRVAFLPAGESRIELPEALGEEAPVARLRQGRGLREALVSLCEALGALLDGPRRGRPDPVFELIRRLTPTVNVDLLRRNAAGEVLLSWREDPLHGAGWHVPGGIIRILERLDDRIATVARAELGEGDEDHSFGVVAGQVGSSRDAEAGLTAAAGGENREQPGGA